MGPSLYSRRNSEYLLPLDLITYSNRYVNKSMSSRLSFTPILHSLNLGVQGDKIAW